MGLAGRVPGTGLSIWVPDPPPPPLAAGGPLPDRLQEALMPVVDYEHCTQPDWWGSLAIRTTMICAGGAEKAGCNVSAALGCSVLGKPGHPNPSLTPTPSPGRLGRPPELPG